MPIDPAEYSADVVLRDGTTLHIRSIRSDDDRKVLDLYSRMSQESLYYRFMSVPRIDLERARTLTAVDPDRHVVLVGEAGGPLAAVAGYYRNERQPERAEVAFSVPDALQGKGIGTRMLEHLAEIARSRGITTFDAYVLGENRRMMDVFLESGFEVTQQLDQGVFHVAFPLRPTAAFAARAAERSQKAAAASMRSFFEPRAIAVVGASRTPGRIGSEILRNLRDTGYTGTLVAVNPRASEIGGVPAYASVAAVPCPVDLAVVVAPAAGVPAVVDECVAKGVRAIVVISAGFGETGPEGREREASLVETIRRAGIRMIGPNCMGIINTDPRFRLNATFSPVYPPEGRVAFSTQSGALGLAILEYVRRINLGISSFASIGNKADVSGNDLIQYWAEDPRTDVILLYLESFGNPVKFGQIARRVGRRKPIVAVKAGRSAAGARAASSHTGARATSDALVETLLRQAGVIRTHTLEELFDVAALLANQPVPAGRRVGIVTNAGGPAILAADACEAHGLIVPALSDETARGLRAFLPAAASVGNPVDMIASAPAEHYRRTIELVLADPAIDSLLVIFIPPLVTQAESVAGAIREATAAHRAASEAGPGAPPAKPVLATFMGAHGELPLSRIPAYRFPESAAVALARATQYGEWLRRPPSEPPVFPDVDRQEARALVTRVLARGGGWMAPLESQALLQCFGIATAAGRVAHSADEAAAAAAIGYPVVVKAAGERVLHKTELNAVKLRLPDPAAVRAAFDDLQARLGDRMDGALVQPMVTGGIEMVVGAVTDPAFGPLVMAGTGGVLVDLLGDTVFRMCPLTGDDAEDMLAELKGRVLLRGYRGAPPADEAAFRTALLRVSQLVETCPEIQEMDINPLLVLATGAVAVDVRVRIGLPPAPIKGRRISY